jgi:hypothetical protein
MTWAPIVPTGSDRYEEITALLFEIEAELNSRLRNVSDPTLLNGTAGMAFYFQYFGKFLSDRTRIKKGCNLIAQSIDSVGNDCGLAFGNGIAGILFSYQHSINSGFFDGPTRFLKKIDSRLAQEGIQQFHENNYDLFYGGLGIANYFLERNVFSEKTKELELLNAALVKTSRNTVRGVGWLYFPGRLTKDDHEPVYNLGFVHGMPSILSFISLSTRLNFIKHSTLPELVAQFLINNQNHANNISRFPNSVTEDFNSDASTRVSRLGYCYGDIGVSLSFAEASRVVRSRQIRRAMTNVLTSTAQRTQSDAGMKDCCFCHGMSGNLHIFNRLYHQTRRAEFRRATLYWLDALLTKRKVQGDISAFDFCGYNSTSKKYELRSELGLLEGYTGVALALLSCISNQEPAWDRSLLFTH